MFRSKVKASAVEKFTRQRENLEEALRRIDDEFDNAVQGINNDMANLDAATLDQRLTAAQSQRDKKSEIIRRQIDALRG